MRPLEAAFSPPIIYATGSDQEKLNHLLVSEAGGAATPLLRQEISRLSPAAGALEPFVGLGTEVTFRDLRTKRERTVTVVLQPSATPSESEVPVSETLGAALLGLPEGAVFRWTEDDGRIRAVRVLRVEAPRSEPATSAGRSI
ncbi:GreA/GreB family elongation factor [Phenylobacterium sp. LjRoot164]|uniref:GreA/GreB family elongation factor n=1 Tax=unclassified Phenylobacterium TaxID=2640670 RepID=UPI003ECDAD96